MPLKNHRWNAKRHGEQKEGVTRCSSRTIDGMQNDTEGIRTLASKRYWIFAKVAIQRLNHSATVSFEC
jgi:hypothetical protein